MLRVVSIQALSSKRLIRRVANCIGLQGATSWYPFVTSIRGSLIMFCNTHLQPLCLLQFFKDPPPPSITPACTHLTGLSNQLSMTGDHVDWGMSKVRPSKNARASSAFWNCFPFSCLLTEGNKNQSQGAKSCEYGGWVTSWPSPAARKSRVTAAVCALALSWWSNRPRTPVRGRRLRHAWKTWGKQWLTYKPAVTVFLSSVGMVATWPNFAKKGAVICLEAPLFLLNFTGGFSSGKTHTTVASSLHRIAIPRFRLVWRRPNREETFLRQMFLACGYTTPPYPTSALHSSYGPPSGHNVSLCQGSCKECEWDFPIKSSWYPEFQRVSFWGPSKSGTLPSRRFLG